MKSITQTIIPFDIQPTDQQMTAQSGLALVGQFIHHIGLAKAINQALPAPGSGRGYLPHAFVTPLMLTMIGGGHSLEDVRIIQRDSVLCKLLQINVPSTDALGDWLRRVPVSGLQQVNRQVIAKQLTRGSITAHTLDADATQIVAEKQSAKFTYKGEQGYMPMVGHLAESGLILHAELREGNVAPADSNLAFIKACEAQLPAGHTIAHIRQDSAAYQADVFNYCEANGKTFAIGGRLDKPTLEAIEAIPKSAWIKRADCHVAETVHTMNDTKEAFRIIVVRYLHQAELFEDKPRYHVICSNRKESAEATLHWYRQRGEVSENGIKELKIGFGLAYLPCGQFGANEAYFAVGVLAHNVFALFKQNALDESMQKCKVATIRWRVLQTAGKLVNHARRWVLQVGRESAEILIRIRERMLKLSLE